MVGLRGERVEQLGMASTGLALTTSPVVAASRDEKTGEDDDEDGRGLWRTMPSGY